MDEEGRWVTIRGRHVFIKNGQTASEAIKEYEENKNKTSTTYYRGLTQKYDPNYDKSKLDNPNGYESWTDSLELAKEYAGKNGYVYSVEIPNNELNPDDIYDQDGERSLMYYNDKPVALHGVEGEEFMLYTDHEKWNDLEYKEVPVKDVEWAGDDLSEWGYFPKGKDSKIIYHAGDLGIGRDTTYANMTNQSRGTGHFGTGTYFVSSQDELQHGTYKDRPIKAVDISDYNLYKPKNSVEAEHLHDFLKEINDTKWDSEERYSKLVEGKKEYDKLYDDISKKNNWTYDFSQEDYKKMNDKLEAIFKDSDCYYENREEFTNSYDYRNADPKDEGWYNQFLEEKYNDLKDYLYSESNRWKRIKENVSSQISNDDINKGLEAVKKYYEKYKGIPTYTLMGQKQDSLSTIFMKSLGYEGVDVSGIKDFDNVTYGSVIYNLKNDHEDYSNLKSFESIGEKYNGPTNMYLNRYISLGQTGQTNENTMKIIKSNIENLKIEAPEDITLYHGGKPDENIEDSLILSTSVSKRVAHLYGRNISKIEIKKGDPIISTYNAQYDRFREIPEEHTHWKNQGEIVLVPSMGNFKEIAPGVFAFIKK